MLVYLQHILNSAGSEKNKKHCKLLKMDKPLFLVLLMIPAWLLVMLIFGLGIKSRIIIGLSLSGLLVSGVAIWLAVVAHEHSVRTTVSENALSVQTSEWEKSQESFLIGIDRLTLIDSNGFHSYSKALPFFDRAIQFNPVFIEAKYWKVQCEIHLGQFNEALISAESAIGDCLGTNHKLLPDLYTLAGAIRWELGDKRKACIYWKQAADIYQNQINQEGNNIMAVVNKAIVLCYMGRKPEALHFLEENLNDKTRTLIVNQVREWIIGFDIDNLMAGMIDRPF